MMVSLGPKSGVSAVGNLCWSGAILGKMKEPLNKYKVHTISGW